MSEWERAKDGISKETTSLDAGLPPSYTVNYAYPAVPPSPMQWAHPLEYQDPKTVPSSIGPPSKRAISLRFWGVRGAMPDSNSRQYGGNTSCLEISIDGQRIIFDAGTGLPVLGQAFTQSAIQPNSEASPFTAHIFLSLSQWGRTQGLSFFQPAFIQKNHLSFYGPVAITGASLKHQLMDQLRLPLSAVSLRDMQATLAFQDIASSDRILLQGQHGPIEIEARLIHPPAQAMGYRLRWQGLNIVYGTAFEPNDERSVQSLLDLSQSADLLIYGAANVSRHLRSPHKGTPLETKYRQLLQHLNGANVRQVLLTRHPPLYSDAQLQALETTLKQEYSNVALARENSVIQLCP